MTEDFPDTELLIEEVRKRPEIWDVSSELYKDKHKKQSAWIGICQQFIVDFDEKDEKEKNEIGKNISLI